MLPSGVLSHDHKDQHVREPAQALRAGEVDIVDSAIFDEVRGLGCKYVVNELKGEYFELLREESTTGDGVPQS